MTLKTRILILNAVAVLLVSITIFSLGKMIQNEIEERFVTSNIDSTHLLWNTILENQMDAMEANVTALARDRETRNALRDMNIDTLSESIKTSYNLLSSSGIISGVELTDKEGKIVAATPETEAVNTRHPLMVSALKEGKVMRGIVNTSYGKPSIAVAFPLFIRGQVIGGGIYYLEFDRAVETLKRRNNSDVVVLGLDDTVLHSTEQDLYADLELELPPVHSSDIAISKMDDKVFSSTIQSIQDFQSQPVARLVTIKDYTESYHRQSNLTWIQFAVATVVLIGMLVVIMSYTNRSFKKLHTVIEIVKNIAGGDLTANTINDKSDDETGQLNSAMSEMLENLNHMVNEINHTSAKLASSSHILSDVTQDTNSGMQRQLHETDQVATAVNELSATAQEVARNAADVATAANAANDEAQQGSLLSKQLLQAINQQVDEVNNVDGSLKRLQGQTVKISEVVTVINGIAEQINLLALNAAIEAARAGEQGRGFAVVADEVRTLATRTQKSTNEIGDTITQLQNETDVTVAAMDHALAKASETEGFVLDTTERLNSIAGAVESINTMITQIASATEEQTSVTEDININVTSIQNIAEQVSSGAQQTTQATDEIAGLSQQMEQLVNKFKTKTQ